MTYDKPFKLSAHNLCQFELSEIELFDHLTEFKQITGV